MKTIALFGGSFDPPHIGQVGIVDALCKLDFIDKVVVMPTYLNPFKSSFFAPSELRLKWLKKIFQGYSKVVVSDFEIQQNKATPTIVTINHLLKSYENIYLVIGADNLSSFHKWQNYDELISKVKVIVAPRDGENIDKNYITIDVKQDISSTILRKKVDISMLPKQCAKDIEKFYKDKNEHNS